MGFNIHADVMVWKNRVLLNAFQNGFCGKIRQNTRCWDGSEPQVDPCSEWILRKNTLNTGMILDFLIAAFKIAIVAFTLYLSLSNLNELRSFDLATLGYSAKNQVGNQRFGFLYIIGFWLVFFFQSQSLLMRLAKIPLLLIIFLGLLLTFSRASM